MTSTSTYIVPASRSMVGESAGAVAIPTALFVFGLIVWTTLAACLTRPMVGDAVDDGQYPVAAQSMRAGTGYRLVSRVGSPIARKYPPGVSMLTLAAMELTPGRPTLAGDAMIDHGLMLGCGLLLGIGCRRLFLLMGLGPWCAAMTALAVVFHPLVLTMSQILNSDLPFAAVSTCLLCRWALRWQEPGSAGAGAWLVDGCLIAAAMILRGNGFTLLLAGAAAWWAAQPRRSLSQLAALAGVPLAITGASVLMVAMQKGHADSGFYGSELIAGYSSARHIWDVPLANIERMPSVFTWIVWSMSELTMVIFRFLSSHGAIRLGLGSAIVATTGVGLIPAIRRMLGPASAVLFLLTLMVYAVWYFPFDVRFALPILPLILGGFVLAVRSIARVLGAWPRVTVIAAAGVLLGAVLPSTSLAVHAARKDWKTAAGLDPDEVATLDAIERSTPADAVIFARIPELVYLYTARQGAPLRDDTTLAAGKPATWQALLNWLSAASGHPVYFFGAPPFVPGSDDATDTFVNSAPYVIETVYVSPHNHFWLGRLTDRPKTPRPPRTK